MSSRYDEDPMETMCKSCTRFIEDIVQEFYDTKERHPDGEPWGIFPCEDCYGWKVLGNAPPDVGRFA